MRKERLFMRHFTPAAALAIALALPAAAAPQYVSWQGTWHLNKAETHYPPGVMVTANDLTVSIDDGKLLKFSETVTNAGNTTTQTFDGAYDGKPVDLGGGETMAFKHVSANSYLAIRHNKDGFLLERTVFVLSNGGKKLTCHVFAQQPGGKPIKFDEIFDKGE
jgi:hypothetical protein